MKIPSAPSAAPSPPTAADRGTGSQIYERQLPLSDLDSTGQVIDTSVLAPFAMAVMRDIFKNDAYDTYDTLDATGRALNGGFTAMVASNAARFGPDAVPTLDPRDQLTASKGAAPVTILATALDGTVFKFFVTVDYTQTGQLSIGYIAAVVDANAATNGGNGGVGGAGGALTLTSTCARYLAAGDAAQSALVTQIRPHLSVTYGSQTTSRYVAILDADCPDQRGRTIQQLLVNLGYYQ